MGLTRSSKSARWATSEFDRKFAQKFTPKFKICAVGDLRVQFSVALGVSPQRLLLQTMAPSSLGLTALP